MTSPSSVQPDRYEKGSAMKFAGIDRPYTFPNLMGIPAQWLEFGSFYGKVPNQIGKETFGVSHDMRADGFDYLSGVQVSSFDGVPAPLKPLSIDAQYCAVFKHQGHVSALPALHQAIWQQWFPQSGKEPAHKPIVEVIKEDFNPMLGMGTIEIWVPVKD